MCAPRKASGNQTPAAVAQSRICTAVGSGTATTIATSTAAPSAPSTIRVRLICRAVTTNARLTVRRVLRRGELTSTKVTA